MKHRSGNWCVIVGKEFHQNFNSTIKWSNWKILGVKEGVHFCVAYLMLIELKDWIKKKFKYVATQNV